MKRSPYIGPPEHCGEATSGRYLKRTIRWNLEGFTWEADPKHAQTVKNMYGEQPAAREISPGSKHIGKSVAEVFDLLDEELTAPFRTGAPTALYLASGRPDIQFACS